MSKEPAIIEWSGDYWFLDNSYPTPIKLDNITYPSVTHAMMGAQAATLDQKLQLAKIPLAGLKVLYESFGSPVAENFRGPDTMRKLLFIKFGYSDGLIEMSDTQSSLALKLLATGSRKLIMGNKVCNQFYGDCQCHKHSDIPGKNVTGGLLMSARERLASYITHYTAKDQPCTCETPCTAFFAYAVRERLWLKPICEKCQAKVGVYLTKTANSTVYRFEKEWFPEAKNPGHSPRKVKLSPVKRTDGPITIPPIFEDEPLDDEDYVERWMHHAWGGAMKNISTYQEEPTKKLPQNITLYLSGRIS